MNPAYWLGLALLTSLTVQTWILPFSVGIVAMVLCVLAVLNERGLLPPEIAGFGVLMNILDRLTNKQQLEALIAKPRPQSQAKTRLDPQRAREIMREGIIGHDAMIDDVISRVGLAQQKIKRTRPAAIFMLAGPPSTGKTEVGQVLSRAIFGNQVAYRLPMNALGHNTSSVLTGSAPGYQGGGEASNLASYLTTHPACVIIVDEFEKASPEVRDLFLGAWNEGKFPNNSQGGDISTTDAIFIVTTNAEQVAIAKVAESFEGREDTRDELSDRCKDVLKAKFGDALLSRVTCVYPMRPLAGMELAELLLKLADNEISEFGLELIHCVPSVLANYVNEAEKRGASARTMRAKIEDEIGRQAGELQKAGHRLVTVVERDGQVFVEPYREAPAAKPAVKAKAR